LGVRGREREIYNHRSASSTPGVFNPAPVSQSQTSFSILTIARNSEPLGGNRFGDVYNTLTQPTIHLF
jgi:hypothetical protein